MTQTGNDLFSFGALLKVFRTRRHLTQQRLAEVIGMHRSAIVRWEQGDFLPENKGIVLELAKRLHLDDQETRHLLEASLTALAPHWLVPLPRNFFFTGREEIMEALHTQLGADQAVVLTQSSGLHGLGGVGKTQIALEYAYRHALEYSAVFWVGAETDEQIVAGLLRIAEVLQLPGRDNKDQQHVIEAVQRWLTTHSQWLLIWDNVEDLPLLHRFLPSARSGSILITTRCQALGTLARGLDLLPMELEEGVLFLLRRAKVLEPEVSSEQLQQIARSKPIEYAAAVDMVTAMGGLPLALDQAGAYIEETGCGLSGYLQLYEQQRAHLLDRRGGPTSDHAHSVTMTFLLAMERLEREQPAATDVLRVCALLHAEAIPEELFLEGAAHLGPELALMVADPSRFDQAIAALRSLSLVQRLQETRTISLHRLVQAVLYERMSEQEQVMWQQRVITALNILFPKNVSEVSEWNRCERLLPHVMTVAAALPDQATELAGAEVLQKAADYLLERAQYEQAKPLYLQTLRIREQFIGSEHPDLVHLLYNLARLSYEQGEYEQAKPLLKRALHIVEQKIGAEHFEMIYPLNGLSLIYWRKGEYEQAEPLLRRALHISEQAWGLEHPKVTASLNNLAVIYAEQGEYEQAEPLLRRALHISEQAWGPEHPEVARPREGLARIYAKKGKYEQAELLYQQALHIREQALGLEHLEVAHLLNNIAELYIQWEKDEQAEPLYKRALHILEQAVGLEHPKVAISLNGLAIIYSKQGKYEQAKSFYQRAFTIRELHLGPHHPDTAQTLHDLAVFHQKQGNLSEARSLAERALKIRLQSLGDAHPETIATRTLSAQLAYIEEEEEAFEQRAEESQNRSRKKCSMESTSHTSQETADPSPSANTLLQEFLDACCELHPRAWCRSSDLWQAYEHWIKEHQERFPLSRGAFIAQLKAHGCRADRTKTARIWRGIDLVKKNDDKR